MRAQMATNLSPATRLDGCVRRRLAVPVCLCRPTHLPSSSAAVRSGSSASPSRSSATPRSSSWCALACANRSAPGHAAQLVVPAPPLPCVASLLAVTRRTSPPAAWTRTRVAPRGRCCRYAAVAPLVRAPCYILQQWPAADSPRLNVRCWRVDHCATEQSDEPDHCLDNALQ